MQRDPSACTVGVQLNGQEAVTTYSFDDVSEYVGEETLEDW